MMPLAFAKTNENVFINNIKGKNNIVSHLENLGFTKNVEVSVISEANGNLIVKIHDCRIAISKSMASKIYVTEGSDDYIR